MSSLLFCNLFDEALFRQGVPAVFLRDREGRLRFDETWTRDAWGLAEGPHEPGTQWMLLRDRGTGYVQFVVATSPSLLRQHPRSDVRRFGSMEEALEALASFGHPALCSEPW